MEEETNNQPPQMPADQMKQPEASTFGQHDHESPSHLGIILGILVVVLISIVGGLYLWGSDMFENEPPTNEPAQPSVNPNPVDNIVDESVDLSGLSESDEINDILNDLEKVDFDSIDAELGAVTATLDNLEIEPEAAVQEPPPPPPSTELNIPNNQEPPPPPPPPNF